MSGLAEERGAGEGEGTTLNVPLPPMTSREQHLLEFEKALDKVFRFNPEFVFISAGYDAHRLDPLSNMLLESEDFGTMTRSVVARAQSVGACGIVSTLEGGYHLRALAESVGKHLTEVVGKQ